MTYNQQISGGALPLLTLWDLVGDITNKIILVGEAPQGPVSEGLVSPHQYETVMGNRKFT